MRGRARVLARSTVVVVMGGVLLLGLVGCAARAPSMAASHPADPAAKGGRLAGPPAILRAARASAVTEDEDAPTPEAHDHGAHPGAAPQHDHSTAPEDRK